MKLLVLFLFIASATFGQDSLLFDYVNQYRVANGVDALTYDADLHEISKSNTAEMLSNDSLMHSGTNTYECATRQFSLAATQVDFNKFNSFLKTYFNDSYEVPIGDNDEPWVIDYVMLYVVYAWHSSADHRAVMLSDDVSIGSCSVDVSKINFKPNYKTIGGQKMYFKKFISHYEISAVATLNLNID